MVKNHAGYIRAHISPETCVGCGVCLKNCPSYNQRINLTKDYFVEPVIGTYIGYANDPDIRQQAQSGGVVTALLQYLLDKKLVDGAVVNMFNSNLRRPEAICVDSKEEIREAAGSHFAQTPVVKTIFENRQKRLAAVLLGCQAESLNLIEKNAINEKSTLEYKIGLVCGGQQSGLAIDDLIAQCKSGDTDEFRFRFRFRFKDKNFGGWPGDVKITTYKNDYRLPSQKRLAIRPLYECHRCVCCYDQLNKYSDIVFGDPWGIPLENENDGYTIIIVRTEKGMNLLENAINDNIISCQKIEKENIVSGQQIETELIPRFSYSKRYFYKKEWKYPYQCDQEEYEINGHPIFKMNLRKRLLYTRKFYLASSIGKAYRIMKLKRIYLNILFLVSIFYHMALRAKRMLFGNNRLSH
jgi:coenzyme F420 hydrogenase subunit beta